MNIIYALYLYGSAVILLILAVIGWHRRSLPAGREFALFSASTALLVASYALELTQEKLDIFKLILHLEWCSAPYISAFWLLFSLVWCGYKHLATRAFRVALMVIPSVDMILAQTNDYHNLVYKALWVDHSGAFPIFMTDNGPVLWIDFAYSNTCILIATFLFIQQYRKAQPFHRRQALIMMMALLIPMLCNIGYYLGIGNGIYITAFGLSIAAMLFSWEIFRHQFLEITPVARHGLVEMMQDPVLVFDEAGRLVDHNRAACRLLFDGEDHETEITRAEISSRTPELAIVLARAERGEIHTFHYSGRAFSLSLTALRPTAQKQLTLCLLHDITEQSQAEENLRELNATLEERVACEVELNRAKDQALVHQARIAAMGEMVSAIAHQWRQPLAILSMIVQDFHAAHQNGVLSSTEWDEFKADAMAQIHHMSQTIEDFRNFQRPDHKRERFPVVRCLKDSLRLSSAQFMECRIVEELCLPQGVSPTCFGTPGQLTQALLNLLINAKEAIEDSRTRNNGHPEQGRVIITLATEGKRLLITIADNGSGVSEELDSRIFEPYITSKDEMGGSGLGLYFAKMLVETGFGGTLNYSSLSEGASFIIELPVTEEDQS
jgi:signal transduction histidine kinase